MSVTCTRRRICLLPSSVSPETSARQQGYAGFSIRPANTGVPVRRVSVSAILDLHCCQRKALISQRRAADPPVFLSLPQDLRPVAGQKPRPLREIKHHPKAALRRPGQLAPQPGSRHMAAPGKGAGQRLIDLRRLIPFPVPDLPEKISPVRHGLPQDLMLQHPAPSSFPGCAAGRRGPAALQTRAAAGRR